MNKQLEPRYVVIKKKDLADALNSGLITESDVVTLDKVSQAVDSIRQQRGKASFECAVVESDWPIYQEVVDKLAAPKPRFFWVGEESEIYCGESIHVIRDSGLMEASDISDIDNGNYGEIYANFLVKDAETGNWVHLYDLVDFDWQEKPRQVCTAYQ